jgi:hypothetical protein
LRGERHLRIGGFGEFLLPAQGVLDILHAAVGVDVAVALGVAGDMQAGEAVEQAGLDQLHGIVEITGGGGDAAAQQQRLFDPGLAPVARSRSRKSSTLAAVRGITSIEKPFRKASTSGVG